MDVGLPLPLRQSSLCPRSKLVSFEMRVTRSQQHCTWHSLTMEEARAAAIISQVTFTHSHKHARGDDATRMDIGHMHEGRKVHVNRDFFALAHSTTTTTTNTCGPNESLGETDANARARARRTAGRLAGAIIPLRPSLSGRTSAVERASAPRTESRKRIL